MNRKLAWMMPLVAARVLLGTTAGAQTPKPANPSPTAKAATALPKAATPVAAGTTPAAPAPLDPAVQKAQAIAQAKAQGQMDVLLDEWEKQSSKVRSLQVIFERKDKLPKWGDKYYQGKAFLQSPDLACLEFNLAQTDKDGKPQYTTGPNGQKSLAVEKDPAERIVCNGREVLQFMWDIHEIYRYPLDKESREKALQQGPLPFLFNMKAAEAKQRYFMTLLTQPDPAQAAKSFLIRIVPRQEIDQKSFKDAYIYLNKLTFMPSSLILIPVGGQERQEFTFTMILDNRAIPKEVFEPRTNLPGWRLVDNPDANANPKALNAAAPPSTGAAAPARGGQTALGAASPAAPKRTAQAPTRTPTRP